MALVLNDVAVEREWPQRVDAGDRGRGSLCGRLVHVLRVDQMTALGAKIAHIEQRVRGQLHLHAQPVLLDVRREKVRVDRVRGAYAARHAGGKRVSESYLRRRAAVECLRIALRRVVIKIADAGKSRRRSPVDPVAAAHHRACVCAVGEAEPRLKLAVVVLNQVAGLPVLARNDDRAGGRVERGLLVVLRHKRRRQLPAQTQVQRQHPGRLPIILEVEVEGQVRT